VAGRPAARIQKGVLHEGENWTETSNRVDQWGPPAPRQRISSESSALCARAAAQAVFRGEDQSQQEISGFAGSGNHTRLWPTSRRGNSWLAPKKASVIVPICYRRERMISSDVGKRSHQQSRAVARPGVTNHCDREPEKASPERSSSRQRHLTPPPTKATIKNTHFQRGSGRAPMEPRSWIFRPRR